MRKLPLIAAALSLTLVGGAAAGAYAWDASRDDLIARGVSAGEVDIGGTRAADARALLQARLAAPLERPLRVRTAGGGPRFSLSAERARLEIDVEAMVQEALARSRQGNAITRTLRDLREERVDAEIPARVSYSRRAVARLVRRAGRAIDRPARDARVSYTATGLDSVPSADGVALRARALQRAVERELVRPDSDRVVRARTKKVRPELATADLAERYPSFITVDRRGYRLRYFRNLEHVKTYRIAVGQVGLETPKGLYQIQNKAIDPAWSVPDSDWAGDLAGKVIPGGRSDNPLKARWMGIYDGAGIHGTADEGSLGSSASHGCIRMAVPEVKELYRRVEVRTPVFIA